MKNATFRFSYIWNMASFEAFRRVISSSINLLFLKSVYFIPFHALYYNSILAFEKLQPGFWTMPDENDNASNRSALNYYMFRIIRRCSSSSFIGSFAGYYGARVWSSRAKCGGDVWRRSWSGDGKKTRLHISFEFFFVLTIHVTHTHTGLSPLFDAVQASITYI